MILPKTNISIIDVRNALNYPSTDLGTLCSVGSPYVNRWAKYKPIAYPFTFTRPSDWWRDPTGACGLKIPVYTNVTTLFTDVDNGVDLWKYQPPTGGANEPFRLGDFAGHNSDALSPVFVSPLPETWYADTNPTFAVSFGLVQDPGDGSGDSLLLSDISTPDYPLQNYYPGLAIKASNSTAVRIITSNLTLGQNANSIQMPASTFSNNVAYEIVMILCSYPQTSFGTPTIAGNYIPLPSDGNIQSVTFRTGGIGIVVDAEFFRGTNGGSNSFTYRIDITNTAVSSPITLSNCSFRYTYGDKDPINGGSFEQGEGRIVIANQTVNQGQTVTVTGTVTNNPLPYFAQRGGNNAFLYTYAGIANFIYGQFVENQDQANN